MHFKTPKTEKYCIPFDSVYLCLDHSNTRNTFTLYRHVPNSYWYNDQIPHILKPNIRISEKKCLMTKIIRFINNILFLIIHIPFEYLWLIIIYNRIILKILSVHFNVNIWKIKLLFFVKKFRILT